MIRHVVMWRVAGESERERHAARRRVRIAFESLRGRIPGLLALQIGEDVSAVEYACDIVLLTDFDSAESLAAYASHPEHVRVKHEIEGLRITRHQVDFHA